MNQGPKRPWQSHVRTGCSLHRPGHRQASDTSSELEPSLRIGIAAIVPAASEQQDRAIGQREAALGRPAAHCAPDAGREAIERRRAATFSANRQAQLAESQKNPHGAAFFL